MHFEVIFRLVFRSYFVIGFKDKQTELWDVNTLTIIRETGKSLPIPTAIEWSPTFTRASKKKHKEGDENNCATMSQSSTSVAESGDG